MNLFRSAPPSEPAPASPAAVDPLTAELAALVDVAGSDSSAMRPALLAAVRSSLNTGREEIRHRFVDMGGSGADCVRDYAKLIDRIVAALAEVAASHIYPSPNPTVAERFAVVANGGYGRGEMAPCSDVDLLFLLPYRRTGRVEQIVETVLYALWDLGLKVGQAVRSVDECIRGAKADMTIRTTLLESRLVWGEQSLFDTLRRRYRKDVVRGGGLDFVEAKLAERDERHKRLGDSRFVLEPNVKDGKGGLRDLHTLFWIGKYLYQVETVDELVVRGMLTRQEAQRFAKASRHLTTLRCHLHYLTGRTEERLTFDLQREIAARLGYADRAGVSGVERLMRHYFLVAKDVGDLTRIFCAALEAESRRKPRRPLGLFMRGTPTPLEDFVVDGERLDVADQTQFETTPLDMIRLFEVAQRHDVDIHPNALKLITRSLRLIDGELRRDPEANRLFLSILTSEKDPEQALRRMNGAGVLGRFIPDFGRVVAQMQFDMYHVFTVDEHTLRAIGFLSRIDRGDLEAELPLAAEALTRSVSRRALYVAVLLHDIAKGRGGDHSEIGSRIARRLGPRFGLDDEETETVEWLVRHHLLMSRVALKRDIEDAKAINDFVRVVESPERLRLLLVLTVADINAVGPGRWNAWKGTLLGRLFHRAQAIMSGGFDVEDYGNRVTAAQQAARDALPGWSEEAIADFLSRGYPPYWLSLDTDTHIRHAGLLRELDGSATQLLVDTRVDRRHEVTEVTIITPDHPGLFSRLAGALAVCGANILDAKIFTLADGMAVDIFNVQDAATGGAFDAPDKLARLSVNIDRGLSGALSPVQELARRRSAYPSRTRALKVQPRVLIDNEVSRSHTVIEVNARDRPGLLYDLTRALTRLSLQISSAKISTVGLRAVDVFYVKDVFGLKVTHETKLEAIRDALLAALIDPDCAPAPQSTVAAPVRRRPASRRTGVVGGTR